MSGQAVTEVQQTGGCLVVKTRIECMERVLLTCMTSWAVSSQSDQILYQRTELGVGSVVVRLIDGPIPLEHVAAVRDFARDVLQRPVSVKAKRFDLPKKLRRVFLANREDGCEVFADADAARFWSGDPSCVRDVTVRAAASALKTDEATVTESAGAATEAAWVEISAGLSLKQAAQAFQTRLETAGISIETLELKVPLRRHPEHDV
ncbi:MAG: hypothetical protein HXY34_02775 [Candidatus Thorarchaeota archaeon]|nr:hypothetical protein [Candidatus Thorarchaeota archaeon]